jgi:hypothetical protein
MPLATVLLLLSTSVMLGYSFKRRKSLGEMSYLRHDLAFSLSSKSLIKACIQCFLCCRYPCEARIRANLFSQVSEPKMRKPTIKGGPQRKALIE